MITRSVFNRRPCTWYPGGSEFEADPVGTDSFGPVFSINVQSLIFTFKFRDKQGDWEEQGLEREFRPFGRTSGPGILDEIWCKADKPFIYPVARQKAEQVSAADFLNNLRFNPSYYVPGTGGFSGLGATVLEDGKVLFGLYHPNAGKVYVRGSFNGWQRPWPRQGGPRPVHRDEALPGLLRRA